MDMKPALAAAILAVTGLVVTGLAATGLATAAVARVDVASDRIILAADETKIQPDNMQTDGMKPDDGTQPDDQSGSGSAKMGTEEGTHTGDDQGTTPESDTKKVEQPERRNVPSNGDGSGQ